MTATPDQDSQSIQSVSDIPIDIHGSINYLNQQTAPAVIHDASFQAQKNPQYPQKMRG